MMKTQLKNWSENLLHPGLQEGALGREKEWYDHYFKNDMVDQQE